MHVIFEESGKLALGRVLSQADASAQIELDSGKRSKVKLAQVLVQVGASPGENFMANAHAAAAEVDLALAWEAAPDEAFGFTELAAEYFGASPSVLNQSAMLFALHDAPHYFRRNGKGQFRKADAQTLALALAAIERKRVQQAQIDQWTTDLVAGICPASVRENLFKLLFKPDKNAPEYKAVAAAARQAQLGALALLERANAIDSPYAFHWQRFLLEQFPKGIAFAPLPAPNFDVANLPLSTAQAFSIDDSQTTEIDDALSVQGLGTGTVTVGIHIAAPGLGMQAGDAVDTVARARMSTVYAPGNKITMLPDDWVRHFTLDAGKACAAVSLLVTVDEASCAITGVESRVERVHIAHNLRHDVLGEVVTLEWLMESPGQPPGASKDVEGLQPELAFLHRFALARKAERELVRGKPENFNRPDYNFKLDKPPGTEPLGNEIVHISVRPRGEPLDLIVAECMIVANHHWGQRLANCGLPGIYRSQHSLAPGMKVRMGTKALPHAGIGVPCYAWSTSPLRRYTDMVNQWQIIASIQHGATAALVAPFKPKDAGLLGIIGAFDAAYASYNAAQNEMERFWTLKHIAQSGIEQLEANVIKDQPELVLRAADLPLVFTLGAGSNLARGQRVRVAVVGVDLIGLQVHTRLLEVMNSEQAEEPSDDADEADSAPKSLEIALDSPEALEQAAAG